MGQTGSMKHFVNDLFFCVHVIFVNAFAYLHLCKYLFWFVYPIVLRRVLSGGWGIGGFVQDWICHQPSQLDLTQTSSLIFVMFKINICGIQIWYLFDEPPIGYTTNAAIHSKSGSPGSPDSANYLNFPQNCSLRTRNIQTLLWWILSQGAKAEKMCQSVVENAKTV